MQAGSAWLVVFLFAAACLVFWLSCACGDAKQYYDTIARRQAKPATDIEKANHMNAMLFSERYGRRVMRPFLLAGVATVAAISDFAWLAALPMFQDITGNTEWVSVKIRTPSGDEYERVYRSGVAKGEQEARRDAKESLTRYFLIRMPGPTAQITKRAMKERYGVDLEYVPDVFQLLRRPGYFEGYNAVVDEQFKSRHAKTVAEIVDNVDGNPSEEQQVRPARQAKVRQLRRSAPPRLLNATRRRSNPGRWSSARRVARYLVRTTKAIPNHSRRRRDRTKATCQRACQSRHVLSKQPTSSALTPLKHVAHGRIRSETAWQAH